MALAHRFADPLRSSLAQFSSFPDDWMEPERRVLAFHDHAPQMASRLRAARSQPSCAMASRASVKSSAVCGLP